MRIKVNHTRQRIASGGRRAFTLIELLVVIAIVAVLAALISQLGPRIRGKAKLVRKTNNLRQIWMAHTLFAGDNNGRALPAKDASMGEEGENWHALLAPYVFRDDATIEEKDRFEVFVDPFFDDYDPENAVIGGYAMNVKPGLPEDDSENAQWDPTLKDNEKKFNMFAITQETNRIFLADSSKAWFVKDTDASDKLDMTRHDDKGMALMYDGSTRMFTLEEAKLAVSDPAQLDLQ